MVILLGGLAVWATPARAEGLNLTTSPLPINLAGPPGSTLTTQIRVKNGSNSAQPLKVSLMKFAAAGEEGKPELLPRGPGDAYFDWVSFSPQSFLAAPNEWQTVTMTVKLPPTAAFGYYYAVVFSSAQPVAHSAQQSVVIGSSAVLVLVDAEVPGAKRQLSLEQFKTDHQILEFLPANFELKFHNAGNIHVVPQGDVFIKQGKKIVATLRINTQNGNILPNSNRIFELSWADGFPVYQVNQRDGQPQVDKNGRPKHHLSWDFSKVNHLKFGHYTAQLVAVYDNGQRDIPLEATLSFWVVPWRILAGGLVILALVGAGLYSILRGLWRRLRSGP